VAGAAVGLALGVFGMLVPPGLRAAILTVLAALVVLLGLSGRVPLLQANRETDQRLLEAGPIRWAIANGAMLGAGAASRIGFWVWYFVPLLCFALARPAIGSLMFGVYGGVRMTAIAAIALVVRQHPASHPERRAIALQLAASRLDRLILLPLGTCIVLVAGL